MQRSRWGILLLAWLVAGNLTMATESESEVQPSPLIIAHRGASGYLPEHTLEAYALAYAMGADLIEPDVVLSKDGVLICCHDTTLNQTTDVAKKFPDRHRADGKYYCLDFTLDELKTLWVHGHNDTTIDPGYQLATLEEMLSMVHRLNQRTDRKVGTIPEPKAPGWHEKQGSPIEPALLETYKRFGYSARSDNVIIQCFELASLKKMRHELGSDLRMVFLFGLPVTDAMLDEVAMFADGIGPSRMLIENKDGKPVRDLRLVHEAHRRGLKVYPYTLYNEPEVARRFLIDYRVDGMFSDFPDVARRARDGE